MANHVRCSMRCWSTRVFEVKVPWFSGSYSGLLDPIIVLQASLTRSFCVASTDYKSFSGSLKLMTSQVEQDACSFQGAYGRNGRQWVNIHVPFVILMIPLTFLSSSFSPKRILIITSRKSVTPSHIISAFASSKLSAGLKPN